MMFSPLRYHIWHISRLCLVSKTHFSWFVEWTTTIVYERAFVNFAIYRVFRQYHHRNLIQSSNIYLEHSSRVSICSTTVAQCIISVCGCLNISKDQVKWIWWHHFLIWYQEYSEEVLRKLQHNLWCSILSFLNLDKYSRVWENSLFVVCCPDTLKTKGPMVYQVMFTRLACQLMSEPFCGQKSESDNINQSIHWILYRWSRILFKSATPRISTYSTRLTNQIMSEPFLIIFEWLKVSIPDLHAE